MGSEALGFARFAGASGSRGRIAPLPKPLDLPLDLLLDLPLVLEVEGAAPTVSIPPFPLLRVLGGLPEPLVPLRELLPLLLAEPLPLMAPSASFGL